MGVIDPLAVTPAPGALGYTIQNRGQAALAIATRILVPAFVTQMVGLYDVIPESVLARTSTNARRAPGTAYTPGNSEFTQSQYSCAAYGDEMALPDEHAVDRPHMENVNGRAAVEAASRAIEQVVQGIVHNTTTFAAGNDNYYDASGAPWTNIATADPQAALAAAGAKLIKRGIDLSQCTLQINWNHYKNIPQMTKFRSTSTYNERAVPGTIDTSEIARWLGVKDVIVGAMHYNSANMGQAVSMSPIWPDTYASLFLPASGENAPFAEPCIGRAFINRSVYNFSGEQMVAAMDAGMSPLMVFKYRQMAITSSVIRAEQHADYKIINNKAAVLIKVA